MYLSQQNGMRKRCLQKNTLQNLHMEKSAHFLIIQYFKIPLKFLAGILNKPFPMLNKCGKQRMYTEKKEVNDTYYLIFKENLTPTNSTIKFNWMKITKQKTGV